MQFREELCHKGVSRIPRTAFVVSLVIRTVRSFLKVGTRLRQPSCRDTVNVPGEAESGSAGTQPDKEYPGLRCANGASDLWRRLLPGVVLIRTLDIGVMPFKIQAAKPLFRDVNFSQCPCEVFCREI